MSAQNVMTLNPEQAVYTLVVGLGKTGLSVVRYLRGLGENIIVVDSRDIPPGLTELKDDFSDVRYHTGCFDDVLFVNAHRIIVSPGVALSEPALVAAKNNNIEIIGDIDLFAHEVNAPVVGITGSNGKSTVTTLLTLMASQAGLNSVASGNIGTPVLDSLSDDVDLYVLELSSFQLETLHRLPMKASVVLNISADHLDRYESVAAYALSKQVIYDNADVLVVNRDDELAGHPVSSVAAAKKQIGFTLNTAEENEFGFCEYEKCNDFNAENSRQVINLCFGNRYLVAADELKIKGRHNLQNALAALALGYALGLPLENMIAALKSFSGLPHRSQFVAQINNVNWINDSKATNVGACVAALEGLPGKHVLIAGGESKGADFSELTAAIEKHCRAVVLIGKDAEMIRSIMPQDVTVSLAGDMSSAVAAAQSMAHAGDNVLLAPACASFDMFDNFEHRGDVFMQSVEALKS